MTTTRLAILLMILLGPGFEAHAQQTNWIEVAHALGGSGSALDGRYIVLVPVVSWGEQVTPPSWLEFTGRRRNVRVRGSLPLLRDGANVVIEALEKALPEDAHIERRNTFGKTSPRIHVRFEAKAHETVLATRLRAFFERTQPASIGRLEGIGVVKKDRFECEDFWSIVRPTGEVLCVAELAKDLLKDGTWVQFTGERRRSRTSFGYFGAVNYWRAQATIKSAARLKTAPPRKRPARDLKAWAARFQRHATALLADGKHESSRLTRQLASGFDKMRGPGFNVCPRCNHKLGKSWLFTDSGHDRVEATLLSCARDGLYFLSRDGHHYGPFHPLDQSEKKR